jgi:uncharacterized protein
MNPKTVRLTVAGPAGVLACALDEPPEGVERQGLALVCHPHPLHGGTMDNKVVQTIVRAALQRGWRCVRFNFRGVSPSEGAWDGGQGEIDDALTVLEQVRQAGEPLVVAGFSFGGYVASHVASRLAETAAQQGLPDPVRHRVLVGPAVRNFPMAAVPQDTAVIHGETDDVVLLSDVMDWARTSCLPVTVVPATGHFFHGQLPLLKNLVGRALAP